MLRTLCSSLTSRSDPSAAPPLGHVAGAYRVSNLDCFQLQSTVEVVRSIATSIPKSHGTNSCSVSWLIVCCCIADLTVCLCVSQATLAGDKLLLESAGCPLCSPEIGGQGAAATELLKMVDISHQRGIWQLICGPNGGGMVTG